MPTRPTPTTFESVTDCLAAAGPIRGPLAGEVREAIRASAPGIAEAVMWNAPTFLVGGRPFATLHLRGRDAVTVVFHRGAKTAAPARPVTEPDGWLDWRSADRALLAIRDAADLAHRRQGLQALVRAWIAPGPDA